MDFPGRLGVVLPTLDCSGLVGEHLATMHKWLDLADQVVVVDSGSSDGTFEIISQQLNHRGLSIHTRPKGLYEAWNFGVSQLRTEYTYISTVGDAITRDGLVHLMDTAGNLGADVVISQPLFVHEDGTPATSEKPWPPQILLEQMRPSLPCLLDHWTLFYLQYNTPTDAILGSSASNLYRTKVLQNNPFPSDYSTVGDGAWSIANLFDLVIALTPETFSTFRYHAKSYSVAFDPVELDRRLFSLLVTAYENRMTRDADFAAEAESIGWPAFFEILRDLGETEGRLDKLRSSVLWIFNAAAWRNRSSRNSLRRELAAAAQRICKSAGRENSSLRVHRHGD